MLYLLCQCVCVCCRQVRVNMNDFHVQLDLMQVMEMALEGNVLSFARNNQQLSFAMS